MGHVVSIPVSNKTNRYSDRLETIGAKWSGKEKKIIDRIEFLEAMLMVLDDVKMTNIQNRDYAMMEIISEEIIQYQKRLEEERKSFLQLRLQSNASSEQFGS